MRPAIGPMLYSLGIGQAAGSDYDGIDDRQPPATAAGADGVALDGGDARSAGDCAGRWRVAEGERDYAVVQPGALSGGADPFGAAPGVSEPRVHRDGRGEPGWVGRGDQEIRAV